MVVTGGGVVVGAVVVVVGTGVVVDDVGGACAADSLLQPVSTSADPIPTATTHARTVPNRTVPNCLVLLDRTVLSMKKTRPTFRHLLLERQTIPAQRRHRPVRRSRCGSDGG
ncbi:hypothetical protein RhoFasGS6_04422 [Rhodococcus fascians]|nr:hypothetical protein [Rhodococcus fascians]